MIGLIINNQVDYIAYVNNVVANTNYYTEACFGQNEILIEDDLGCIYNDFVFIDSDSIYGCIDPLDFNYNSLANIDDEVAHQYLTIFVPLIKLFIGFRGFLSKW